MNRTDINKAMIIGSGPIVIGQACKALREQCEDRENQARRK